ncbi:hypothetical protein Harman_41410 [Haloarcula mannanilytica]|uniref:pyruvate, water dikinase n=1 Tax=Haloarcula mannanilytica TaxID=2509225 RepID=A0A4C2EPC2_9EURY|nr:hypothetical protein Harman_41410 [Haloarcula mannanilytica]
MTTDTFRDFIEKSNIKEDLFAATDIDGADSTALADTQERAHELLLREQLSASVRDQILEAYRAIGTDGEERLVAVRSSATAEDLPDASFAGQQETFLNVRKAQFLDRIKECWASLFSRRAISYRNQKGYSHRDLDIAVVVQKMVDAEKSGVMFTSHPSTGERRIVIEAAWGLGEAVVSGYVSPDNYVVDRATGEIESATIADKKLMTVRDEETGETIRADVPSDRREERVLSDAEIHALAELGERVEDHYNAPQDVEWATIEDEIFVLQSRPITTISDDATNESTGETVANAGAKTVQAAGDVLLRGLGVHPAIVSGTVRIITSPDEPDTVSEGDIIVAEMTTPNMVPAMKRAAGIVTDEGGMISHTAIVSRELGIPAVVGCDDATRKLVDDQDITIDGDRGTVHQGQETEECES